MIRNKYLKLSTEVGKLVEQKQLAYGNSFGNSGKILQIMFPNGIKQDQYDNMLIIVRILDKLFRIANNPKAFNENPYRDIVGYGLLGMEQYNDKRISKRIRSRKKSSRRK